jgi:hypothetical protein
LGRTSQRAAASTNAHSTLKVTTKNSTTMFIATPRVPQQPSTVSSLSLRQTAQLLAPEALVTAIRTRRLRPESAPEVLRGWIARGQFRPGSAQWPRAVPAAAPGSAPPAGGRLFVPQRPSVRPVPLQRRWQPRVRRRALPSWPSRRRPNVPGAAAAAPRLPRTGVRRADASGRGSCQLDSSCGRVRAAPGRADLRGAREGCQPLELPARLGSPALHSRRCHSGTGPRSVWAFPAGSEVAPHSALYNPPPGSAGRCSGIGPPSARPSPPPVAPRPRPSLPSPLALPPAAPPRGAAPLPRPRPKAPALVVPLFAAHAPCWGSPWLAPAGSRSSEPPHPPRTFGSSLFPVSLLSPTEGLWTWRPMIRRCGRQPGSRAEKGPRQRSRGGGAGLRGHGPQRAGGGDRQWFHSSASRWGREASYSSEPNGNHRREGCPECRSTSPSSPAGYAATHAGTCSSHPWTCLLGPTNSAEPDPRVVNATWRN